MSGKISIVVAEAHQIDREGLRALLEAEADLAVCGDTSDAQWLPDLVEQLRPRVLVLDLSMPGLGGAAAVREVIRRSPETRALILSTQTDEAYIGEAFRNGASGYLLKEASASELIQGIREVASGARYLGPPLCRKSIEDYVRKAEDAGDAVGFLTAREREVLRLTADGLTSARIAARLGISPRTVEAHRANVLRKLGLRNHADLIRYALQRGAVPPATRAGATREKPRRRRTREY